MEKRIVRERPLLEETHYYPFGLTMAGISSSALKGANYPENRRRFNKGTEFSPELDLNWYETSYRSLDPQLGRFWQIDQLAEDYQGWTPYNYGMDNPLLFSDPLGLSPDSSGKAINLPEVVVYGKRPVLQIVNSPGTIISPNYNRLLGDEQPNFDYRSARINGPVTLDNLLFWSKVEKTTYTAIASVIPGAKYGQLLFRLGAAAKEEPLRKFTKEETALLNKLFKGDNGSTSVAGATERLSNLKIPEGLKVETLELYQKVAERALSAEKVNSVVQEVQTLRLQIIEKALGIMK